jgi:uncharacterized membrane protein
MANKTDYSEGKPQSVEALGFYSGSQRVPVESGQGRIAADFERRKSQRREASAGLLRALEARFESLRMLAAQALDHWQKVQARHGESVPRLFVPLLMLLAGMLALGAETFLLAPALDMMGIADPLEQKLIAGPICALAAIIFHYALRTYHAREEGRRQLFPYVLAGVTTIGLGILGVARARNLAFSAGINLNPLAQFMAEHEVLGITLFVFLTLFFPIAAGVAIYEGTESARAWREYVVARRRARILPQQLKDAEKRLEGEEDKLNHDLAALEQRKKEFTEIYGQYYALGQKNGAVQGPYWPVIAKFVSVGGLVFVLAALVTRLFGPWSTTPLMLALLTGLVSGMLAAVYFHRVWAYPSPEQLLRRHRVRFAGMPEPFAPSQPVEEPTAVDLYRTRVQRSTGNPKPSKEATDDSWQN